MSVKVCKWFNNADSPVLLMIDDLANVWVDINGNGRIDPGEDWGYAKYSENSSLCFLNEVILKDYEFVKVTFFTPVGIRTGMLKRPQIRSVSEMINCDNETKQFFKSIHENSRHEVAYHGTTHGRAGDTRYDFIQEWKTFNCLKEAEDTINKGKEIYIDVFGEPPRGGKYCGYAFNEFSDESINNTGFSWWCRYWNRGVLDNIDYWKGEIDYNLLANMDIKLFGSNKVIDIPSTVNGSLFTDVVNPNAGTVKLIGKKVLKMHLIKKKMEEIAFLLRHNLVISIQEHIAPSRNDGKIQMPNIYDDKESLRIIFDYLRDKNVWYCTGSELVDYVNLRNNVKITELDNRSFCIDVKNVKNIKNRIITLKFSRYKGGTIILPGEKEIYIKGKIANIPLNEDKFIFQACPRIT